MCCARRVVAEILGTLAAVILLGCGDLGAPQDAPADPVLSVKASPTLAITGLSDESYDADGIPRRHLAIGSLLWKKQRFGYFSMPLRQLDIERATLRVKLEDRASRPGIRDDIELDQVFSTLQDYGAGFAGVTQSNVNELRVEIVSGDVVRFTLLAARARLRGSGKGIKFPEGLSVITADDQQLYANRSDWHAGSDRILTSGPVRLVDASGNETDGANLAFSLESSGRIRLIGSVL